MVFGTPQMCRKITLETVNFNGEDIRHVDSIKYLGEVCSYIKASTALMLYKLLILPIFDYGDIIYNCLSQTDRNTLQVL